MSSSSLLPSPPRTRSLRKPTTLQERLLNIDTKVSNAAGLRSADGSESPKAQSPSRLPVTRKSTSLLRTASMSTKTSIDGSMPPPPPRVSSKPVGRSEPSRPPVTRSAVLEAQKRSLQQPSSTSRQTRAGSISSTTESNASRQRAIPTSTRSRPVSTSTLPERTSIQQPNTSGHQRNAPSQTTGNVPLRRSTVSKASRPLSMIEKSSSTQPQQIPSPRQTRSSTVSTAAPPNIRLNGLTRSASIQLNDSTILKPPISSPALVDPRRPAFSTLQQHFSPNKNLGPKPQTASYLAPPTPSKLPENKLISAETAKLQAELLQLHLLHRDSASVRKEWEESARHKIGKKFEGVAERNRQLVDLEGKSQIQINCSALKKWSDGSAWGMEEMSMVLGEVITGVWNLSEPGGKYGKVVRRFEKWCSGVQTIIASREGKTEDSMQFVGGLDGIWVHECDMLIRKLEGFKDQLDGLGVPKEDGSSLVQVLNGYKELTQGMLAELGMMKNIEQEALLREEEWIRQSIDEVSDGDEDVGGASWRR